MFIGRTDAEAETLNTLAAWGEELTHLKRPWCWERLKAGGEGDNRGLDCWMASPTRWTWVWESSGSWWWTGRPGGLQSMGSQKVRHHWATEQNIPSDPSPSPLQILSGSPLTIATEEADRTVEALSSCVQVCHYWLERKGRPLMMPPTDADVIMPPKRRVLKDVLWDVSQGPMGWRTSKVQ